MGKKLWEKGIDTDAFIENFTVGKDRELDMELAEYDVQGSLAHAEMLHSIDLLSDEEWSSLRKELNNIKDRIENGKFSIEDGVEDIHSQIELELTRSLGDTGKKIHAGRSRNDQVLVDLRLFYRDHILGFKDEIKQLCTTLLNKSEDSRNYLMPGYTHMQAAMPSSFGLWFGAYAESLTDDLRQLACAYDIVNQNPLGSGAGYGSSFPLDRDMTAELLGFDDLNINVVYAQMSRGKVEQSISFALSAVAGTLNKFAADVCLYNSQNFGFIHLPDDITTGSSIMPHKKNPDVFELIRAKTNRIMSLPGQLMQLGSNLPSGYHRDFQILKELIFPVIHEMHEILKMLDYVVPQIQVDEHIMDDPRYTIMYSVEAVNEKVMKGIPFRDAYKMVAKEIKEGDFEAPENLNHTHIGSIGNIGTARIKKKLDEILPSFG